MPPSLIKQSTQISCRVYTTLSRPHVPFCSTGSGAGMVGVAWAEYNSIAGITTPRTNIAVNPKGLMASRAYRLGVLLQ